MSFWCICFTFSSRVSEKVSIASSVRADSDCYFVGVTVILMEIIMLLMGVRRCAAYHASCYLVSHYECYTIKSREIQSSYIPCPKHKPIYHLFSQRRRCFHCDSGRPNRLPTSSLIAVPPLIHPIYFRYESFNWHCIVKDCPRVLLITF